MSALLFWLSAALATLLTLILASWFTVEFHARQARWAQSAQDCSSVVLWLGCPTETRAFNARVRGLQEILLKIPPQILVVSGTAEEVHRCLEIVEVPESVQLKADTHGYRTYASLSSLEFGDEIITVISHRYHLKRAAFLAEGLKLKTLLYPVGDRLGSWTSKGPWREALARFRAVVDRLFPPNESHKQRN